MNFKFKIFAQLSAVEQKTVLKLVLESGKYGALTVDQVKQHLENNVLFEDNGIITISNSLGSLYEFADSLLDSMIKGDGKFEYREEHHGILRDTIEDVAVGFYKTPFGELDSSYSEELRAEGFVMDKQESIAALTSIVHSVLQNIHDQHKQIEATIGSKVVVTVIPLKQSDKDTKGGDMEFLETKAFESGMDIGSEWTETKRNDVIKNLCTIRYYMFGEVVALMLENLGWEYCVNYCRENSTFFDLFRYDPLLSNPTDLLDAMDGWRGYAVLNEEQYNTLKSIKDESN